MSGARKEGIAVSSEARWSALSIDEKARLLELANSKRVRGGR